MHIFHKWGKWELTTSDTRTVYRGQIYDHITEYQIKTCETCGKYKRVEL